MIRKWLQQVDKEGISAVLKYFLLAVNRQGNIGNILWAPDGNWLLIDHSWNIPNEPCIKTLVNVDMCQIISIADLGGSAKGWLP